MNYDCFSDGAAYIENKQLDLFHNNVFPIIQQILFTMKDKKVCEQLVEIFLIQVRDSNIFNSRTTTRKYNLI